MKNKGRQHKEAYDESMYGMMNCKGCLTHITRPIRSISSKELATSKFDKKKWIKRICGYFKSQTNTFNNNLNEFETNH